MEWTLLIAALGFSYFAHFFVSGKIYPVSNAKRRLNHIRDVYGSSSFEDNARKVKSFRERIILPIEERVNTEIYKRTPRGMVREIERKLEVAGYPYGMSLSGWIVFSRTISFGLPVPFVFLILVSQMSNINKAFISVVVIAICLIAPNAILNQKIRDRRFIIMRQLPDILDLMTVSVESGLSFDSAMAKVAEKGHNDLSREFAKVVSEIAMGLTRREALSNMVKRCDVEDIRIFISSVIQAEQLGISLGKVLRVQSAQVRIKRRQRAEEIAMKAPVKMIIPTVLFLLPSVFIVLLGPAVIQMRDALSAM
jgi:tight adherence protein C